MSKLTTDHGEASILPPPFEEPPAVHPEVGTVSEEKANFDAEIVTKTSTGIGDVYDHEQYPLPTDEERSTLRKVPDKIPAIAYILCVAELAERASYYATTGVFNNFMEYPLPEGGNGAGAVAKSDINGVPGALGKGVQFASALVLLFTFLAYVFPILGAWIADTKLGRYKTIIWGAGIGAVAHVIMVGGAAPSLLQAGRGIAPFMISFFLLAIGAGIFKPNVAPTVIDQYQHQREYTKVLKSGEKVLVDPETTIQRIMVIYYGFINIGAFFALASTYAERYVGFWLAFLLPTIIYVLVIVIFVGVSKKIVKKPPMGSELNDFFKITWICCKDNKFMVWKKNFWDAARPAVLAEQGRTVNWNNRLVTDVGRTWAACQVFLYIPIYSLNDGGIGAAGSNLAGSMTLNGAPNDLLSNFNPLAIIVFTPIMAYGVYPLLARKNIRFGRIKRMTVGFIIAAISGICGGLAQLYVYRTSPCGYMASTCDNVSPISVWWELPMIILGAVSEILVNVTSYELAYSRAPAHMKSVVFSICLFMTALYAAAGEVLTPVINDPYLVDFLPILMMQWIWFGPAIVLFAQTAIFWIRHRDIDEDEYMTYDTESDLEVETVKAKDGSGAIVMDIVICKIVVNEVERRFGGKGLHALILHPGTIHTPLSRHLDEATQAMFGQVPGLAERIKSVEKGAATTVLAATAAEWKGRGGKYLEDCAEAQAGEDDHNPLGTGYVPHTYDMIEAGRLWKDSLKMVGLSMPD